MRRALILAAALVILSAAHARHHRHATTEAHWSLLQGGSDIVTAARSQLGNGAIYGRATLWCARFVNWVLARTGHRGTGSDAAVSFSRLPATTLHPGAIAVMNHHVGIVSGVSASGDPVIVSGNNACRVREGAVSRRRVLRFVEAE